MALLEAKTLLHIVKFVMIFFLILTVKTPQAIRFRQDDLKPEEGREIMEFRPQDHSETPRMGSNPCTYIQTPPSPGSCNHP